jgi:hypothetical protein
VAEDPLRSYERTVNSFRLSWPRRRTRVPGCSFSASQTWLNQTAVISPLSSAMRACTIESRREGRRTDVLRTSPAIATSSSPASRSAIRTSSAAAS